MNSRIFSSALIILLISAGRVYSQDSHYWNIQYGTRSTLLGGAVIGSVSDLSATYYNPGAVALFPEPKFILSAKIYELNTLKIVDGAGDGKDLDFSSIVPSPSFVAFNLDFDWLGDGSLALSILTRQSMNFEFSTRRIVTTDFFPNSPGQEEFAGGISVEKEFNEIWTGLTYAQKVSSIIGLGVTTYIAYRNQENKNQTVIQVLSANNKISSLTDITNFKYQNFRLLWKAGIGINLNPLTLGITFTTPSINVAGSGSGGKHYFLNGVDLDGNGTDDNIFESTYQEDLKSRYKNSWSAGIGAAYRFKDLKIHLAGEYYNDVKTFDVVETRPYIRQSTGETITPVLNNALKNVFNLGIGADYFLNERFIISGGFTTDFTAFDPKSNTNLTFSTWDIYHLSGGTTFYVGKSEITLGLAYSFGSKKIEQLINLTPSGSNNSVGIKSDTELKSNRIKILFGFNF